MKIRNIITLKTQLECNTFQFDTILVGETNKNRNVNIYPWKKKRQESAKKETSHIDIQACQSIMINAVTL